MARLYYERGPVKIYHGDCLEWLPTLEAGIVDAVVTDPPYGIAACNRSDGGVGSIASGSKYYGREAWDLKPVPEAVQLFVELSLPSIVWGGNYYDLPPTSCLLIWDKMQRDFTFADCEIAWTNLNRAARIFSYSRRQLVAEGKEHPTQKPVPLMEWCIEQLRTVEGDRIIDPFGGSFTTAVACIRTGRNFIGCELEERYCEIGAKRCDRELDQGRLPFAPPEPAPVQREMFE